MIQTLYDYGQTVYLKTDEEQKQFMVGDILLIGGRVVKYQLSKGTYCGWHEESEISEELDLCKKLKQD